MKQNPRLLLFAVSILLTLACLGTPQPTALPASNSAVTPEFIPSATPQATALPEPLGKLKIAYILDGNVWFWSEATSARQLTSDGDATRVKISDDSEAIVYLRGQTRLWVIRVGDQSPQELNTLGGYASYEMPPPPVHGMILSIRQFDFQPRSHWVYFNTEWVKDKIILPSNDLHRVNVDDPKPEILTIEDGGNLTFSPDGNLIALSSLSAIHIYNPENARFIRVLSYITNFTRLDYAPKIVWLSNGTGFYTVLLPADLAIHRSKYFFVSVVGTHRATLAEFECLPSEVNAPVISPDGLKVAYVKRTANTDELHIIEDSTADTIIASYEGAPMLVPWNWSPDSKRVVFSNAHPMLLLTAGIGILPSPLTEPITPYSLRWVSADRFIFFREGNLLIGVINSPETILIASGFSNQADTKDYDFTIGSSPE